MARFRAFVTGNPLHRSHPTGVENIAGHVPALIQPSGSLVFLSLARRGRACGGHRENCLCIRACGLHFKQGAGSSNAIRLKTTTTTEHADSTE